MSTTRDGIAPAERLLDTEGIRAVGIDRLLAEAKVARASLYQNFGSKDALIVAYLRRQHAQDRATYERAAAKLQDPVERVTVVFELAAKAARRRLFRGCLYLNTTEFTEPSHPVAKAVQEHRQWLADLWTAALREASDTQPASVVAQLIVLYDGGLAGSKASKSVEPIHLAKQMAVNLLTHTRHQSPTAIRRLV